MHNTKAPGGYTSGGLGILGAMVHISPVIRSGGSWIGPKKVVISDIHDQAPYLIRYIIFRTPWFGLQVHHIVAPDRDYHPHNHPRPFLSLILWGGYWEDHIDSVGHFERRCRRPGKVHRMRLDTFHKIRRLPRGHAWTLVAVGRIGQQWGFMTEDGFIAWPRYHEYLKDTFI